MIQEAKNNKIKWLLVKSPTQKNLEYLAENFKLAESDLVATLPPLQRSRVDVHHDYIFSIFQFPYYDEKTKDIKSTEVDFFITKNFIITVNDGRLKPLNELYQKLEKQPQLLKNKYQNDISYLLYEILEQLHIYIFPMLNHISQDLDEIEEKILEDEPAARKTIREMLNIKLNIVNFRKIMQSHKGIINEMMAAGGKHLNFQHWRNKYDHLIGHTVEAWTTLENHRETIEALHTTHESFVTFRINQIMKTLTVFAVIVFPLTLLAAIFGMNAIKMPLVTHEHGFWFIIGIMVVGSIIMWGYFKHKKWI